MHADDSCIDAVECANCGTTKDLLKCSRCHTVWFCGVKCQKAYWPFHKTQCKRNEFADAIEEQEPKFARFLRSHGKQAVLKDDEVDRLERAAVATTGNSRDDVMSSMYGRLDPKPKGPSFSAEERARVRAQEEADRAAARLGLEQGRTYAAIELPAELGMNCQRYKWRQSQSHVEVFVPLAPGTQRSKVHVLVGTRRLEVVVDENPILCGTLYREIKAEESTWYMQDGVLEIIMLKRNRRGHYESGTTNADTFWRAVVRGAAPHETLPLEYPPNHYYSCPCEDGDEQQKKDEKQRLLMQRRKRAAAAAALAGKADQRAEDGAQPQLLTAAG